MHAGNNAPTDDGPRYAPLIERSGNSGGRRWNDAHVGKGTGNVVG